MTSLQRAVFASVLFFILLGVGGVSVFAQSAEQQVEARRKELQRNLDRLEDEIAKQETILREKQQESASLSRDVAILDAEIRKAQLSIEQRNLIISRLTGQIGTKQSTIVSLSDKLEREKNSLAQLIRRTNEIDNVSLVEVVLGKQNLSSFFEDLDAFANIKSSLQESFVEIEDTKNDTHAEKVVLEDTRSQELELRKLQELEKKKIEVAEAEKQRLLDISRGEEARYQQVITTIERSAAQIRAELFQLRGTAAIPFGDALELANKASAQTGVRPALILGVIEQETKLGENIGNCNLPDDEPKYKWYNIMKDPRDTVPYRDITSRLGLDPDMMPLSCPPGYGYGGAMGPAQFIPSTWVLYEDRLAGITGHRPPNPWDPGDAFMASALLLSDNGADRGTYAAERLAALRYFAGWANAENPAYSFYGDGVMSLASKNQKLIDTLAQN